MYTFTSPWTARPLDYSFSGFQTPWQLPKPVKPGIYFSELLMLSVMSFNEVRDSLSGSPTSWVFPHVLKSPRCLWWCAILTPGAQSHWCMCCSCACGSLSFFRTAWGIKLVAGWFVLHPNVQMMHWWVGDVECVSETLEARGRSRASG